MEPAQPSSTPFLKRACYPRWARSTPRIHTACHSGTLVKICFVSLINNTPFLLQTQGGRECPSGVHWHCSFLESPFRQRDVLEIEDAPHRDSTRGTCVREC